MLLAADKENILENIISSYETRIQSIEAFFEATGQIFQDFQDSLLIQEPSGKKSTAN